MKKVISSIVFLAFIGIGIASRIPGFEEVHAKVVTIGPEEAYIVALEMFESAEVKVRAQETGGQPIQVYWCNATDHRAFQSGMADEALIKRVEGQTLFEGTPEGEAVERVPAGDVFIYIESMEMVDTTIDFSVSIYQ